MALFLLFVAFLCWFHDNSCITNWYCANTLWLLVRVYFAYWTSSKVMLERKFLSILGILLYSAYYLICFMILGPHICTRNVTFLTMLKGYDYKISGFSLHNSRINRLKTLHDKLFLVSWNPRTSNYIEICYLLHFGTFNSS